MVQPGLLPVPGQSWPNQWLLQLPAVGNGHCPILANLSGSGRPSAKGFVFLPALEAASASN